MRTSKQVMVGPVPLGGGAPVTVQSMLNVPSTDIPGSVAQAKRLEAAGCQILRAAIPTWPQWPSSPLSKRRYHPPGGGHPLRLQAGPGVRGRRGG